MPDITLRWVAANDAGAATTYLIESDKSAVSSYSTVASPASTNRGDGTYSPYSTTLNGSISAITATVILTSGTNFSGSTFVQVDRELIKLGAKATNTYTSCSRAQGGTVWASHPDLSTVYAAHESYSDPAVAFGARKIIRYRITRQQSGSSSVPVEVLAINPPSPSSANLICLWGVIETLGGVAASGRTVSLAIASASAYGQDTGELIRKNAITATTDDDGFWSLFVRRDAVRANSASSDLTLTVDSNLTWTTASLPDQASVNFLMT